MTTADSAWRENGPFTPYPRPIPIPVPGSKDAPRVALCVNADWASCVRGVLKVLARPETWQGSDSEVQTALVEAMNILDNWEDDCLSDIQFRSPDVCTLQVSLDGGATWTTIFDASACVRSIVPYPTVPIIGTPGAPTICIDYDLIVPAANAAELPVSVSEGDTLTILSHGNDLWTDDSIGYVTGLNNGYCIDGTVADPVLGTCGASEPSHSGDPSSAANHMELLLVIAGVIYRPLAGVVTVPSGVTGARAYFIANDGAPANNLGTQSIVVEHCTTGWIHTFDFTAVNDWTINVGSYSAGYNTVLFNPGGTERYTYVDIGKALSGARTITRVELQYDITPGIGAPGLNFRKDGSYPSNVFYDEPAPGSGAQTRVWTGALSVNDLQLTLVVGYRSDSGDPGGSGKLKKVIISGLGTDPF